MDLAEIFIWMCTFFSGPRVVCALSELLNFTVSWFARNLDIFIKSESFSEGSFQTGAWGINEASNQRIIHSNGNSYRGVAGRGFWFLGSQKSDPGLWF